MHKFRESILDSFDRCFVIIKKAEIVEPLFDFDDTKIFVLLFKLLSVSGMNLTPKANPSLRTLKNLSSSIRIRIQMERIRIHMSKMKKKLKWDKWIRITLW